MPHKERATICIIIPALNEAASIGRVINALKPFGRRIIVADNGSTDCTAPIAKAAGAKVVRVETPGYGRACLAGVAEAGACDILVFMDADGADDPDDFEKVIGPVINSEADLVIGARTHAQIEQGALSAPQRVGNWLACFLMRRIWSGAFTDLGPFRAIRRDCYEILGMKNKTYGWTVEMQVRALKHRLRCTEVPVNYRRRIGKSKISGTARGVILAGAHILGVIFREALSGR